MLPSDVFLPMAVLDKKRHLKDILPFTLEDMLVQCMHLTHFVVFALDLKKKELYNYLLGTVVEKSVCFCF